MSPQDDTTPDPLALPEALLASPAFLMTQILREGRRVAQARPDGARLPHVSVLCALIEFGPASQREVATRLRFDPSDLVAVVNDLEAEGFAIRRRSTVDRRRYSLTVTDEGRAWVHERLVQQGRFHGARLLGALEVGEREQLLALLRRVLASFDPAGAPEDEAQ